MIQPIKLGWMAGVIDLKGRFIYKNNKQRATPQVVLAVESTEISIIRELGSLTGTNPELQEAKPVRDFMRRGCSEHCPEAHVHVAEEVELMMPRHARWTITGIPAAVVVSNLLPFFVSDRGYKEVMNSIFQTYPTIEGRGMGAVYNSLRRLSLLGWELPKHYEDAIEA